MRKLGLFGLFAAFCLGLSGGIEKTLSQPEGSKPGQRGADFVAAFNKGDAKALAGFWTPDGTFVDHNGREYKGRTAIEKLYEGMFAVHKKLKLTLTISSARTIAAGTVMLEEGITEVTSGDGGPPMVHRFSAVLAQKDGSWYFENVRQQIAQPPSHAEHLDELEWLIGHWTGETEKKGESATASYNWGQHGNFIVASFATTLDGVPVAGGTQWIGWDAVDKQIRSWSFYSGGGFGEAVWSKEGNVWSMKTTIKTGHGKKVSVTNVLSRVDAEHLTWHATKLTVDGKSHPDGILIKMKRVKAEQK